MSEDLNRQTMIAPGTHIPHYHGDNVRSLFVAGAVASTLVATIFFANVTPLFAVLEIVGALILVMCAAITNPHSMMIMLGDAAVSCFGFLVYEVLAVNSYATGMIVLSGGEEAIAIILLFALYYSLKTVRSMMLHTVGRRGTFGEFVDSSEVSDDTRLM